MLDTAKPNRAHALLGCVLLVCHGLLVPTPGSAQTPDGVVAIAAEPDHKIRFDNGRVRMYEVLLPKGKGTLVHEHRADSFSVLLRNAEITNEPLAGKPAVFKVQAGLVAFASTAKGPYSHRVSASGESTFHVIVLELMSPTPGGGATAQRAGSAFKVVQDNPRGRAYRLTLAPGESTDAFVRQPGTAVFPISTGRISETVDGMPARLWDVEPGHFRWFETAERLSIRNEGSTPIDLVEIEVF